MNNKPLISIYIPTRNRLSLLQKAVQSVLNQSYGNWELHITDDGSSDGTHQYLTALSKESENIFCYRNNTGKGACAARNNSILNANGEFVTGLDDDDEFTPNRLQLFIDNYDEKYSFISADWSLTNESLKNKLRHLIKYKSGLININRIFDMNHIGNQVFVSKHRVLALGGFDESLTAWQDYDMWVRLIAAYGAAYKIKNKTQLINNDDDIDRITSSPKKILGVKSFLSKHSGYMSPQQIKRINFIIKTWRGT